jgi:CheY-like chemotaxis protein
VLSSPLLVLKGLKILVVDDDPDYLELVSGILAARGAFVCSASTVADAMRVFAEAVPDVIVSDLVMPDGGGLALIQYIRRLSDGEGCFTPAIALSSAIDDGTRRTALRAGFWRFVPKPADAELLCTEVATVGLVDIKGSPSN